MPEALEPLTPAAAEDVADALAFALRFSGRKRVHNADEFMSEIVARRLVEHLERATRMQAQACSRHMFASGGLLVSRG